MHNFPKQRIPFSEKAANNFKWAKDVVESIVTYQAEGTSSVVNKPTSEYNRKLSNYQLYNNQINQEDFARECNPLGLDIGQFKDYIQPYNKTYNKIQSLLTDESSRPFAYRAILVNSSAVQAKLAHRETLIKEYVDSAVRSIISTMPDFQSMENPPKALDPVQIDSYMKFNYREMREHKAQTILQYLHRQQDLADIKNDAFKHALISGDEIVYVGIRNGEPYVANVNPLRFGYIKSGEAKWIQKSLAAWSSVYMTPAEVLDNYTLSDEEAKEVDATLSPSTHGLDFEMGKTHNYLYDPYGNTVPGVSQDQTIGQYGENHPTSILVTHVEWISQKRVGFLSFMNEYGDLQTDLVSEDFVIPEEAVKTKQTLQYSQKRTVYTWMQEDQEYSLYWGYVPEVWTATKIGNNIYTMIGPKELQFRSKDNPNDVSLGYHGVIYNATNASPVSLMDRMKPFQYLYFIVMHKLKELIAQDQGKVFHFDTTMVDPKIGLEKTLYYLKKLNIDFFNPLANADVPGQAQRGKISGETDMSNMQFILSYINILAALDNQISEVAGVSRQKEGQAAPSEAVTNVQSNIQMSSMVTEVYYRLHAKLWEKVLSSLVAAASHAYRNKRIVRQFVLDDLSSAMLQIDPDELSDAEIGVFVTDSGKEHEMFQALKGMADGLLNTNRATFSDLISLYDSTSLSELKQRIRSSEENAAKRESDSQQAEIQAQQQALQAQHQFELEKQARDHQNKIDLAQIEVFKFQKDMDIDNNGVPDPLEIEKFVEDTKLKRKKLELDERKLALEEDKAETDAELRKKEIKIKARKSTSK